MSKMPAIKIGVTGTIASGKSTVTNYLSKLYPTISSDDIVHAIYANRDCARLINKAMFNLESDQVDLSMISSRLFADQEFKEKLEAIIHPLVKARLIAFSKAHSGIIILEIPLLFEANMEDIVDYSILVKADEEVIIDRLIKNRNYSRTQALSRIKNQLSVDDKVARADFVIENNQTNTELELKVQEVIKKIEEVI
ncbi:MAG: dephospho-CoA kinase [Erysipelothrix sp.]|nr:dephospho-CoA kinase [Erysipelothrix sp.]